ncbi:hypothetical protein BHM03_00028799, partial [Ensete ventricosum]
MTKFSLFFSFSVQNLPVSYAVLLNFATPIMASIGAMIILQEKLSRSHIGGTIGNNVPSVHICSFVSYDMDKVVSVLLGLTGVVWLLAVSSKSFVANCLFQRTYCLGGKGQGLTCSFIGLLVILQPILLSEDPFGAWTSAGEDSQSHKHSVHK